MSKEDIKPRGCMSVYGVDFAKKGGLEDYEAIYVDHMPHSRRVKVELSGIDSAQFTLYDETDLNSFKKALKVKEGEEIKMTVKDPAGFSHMTWGTKEVNHRTTGFERTFLNRPSVVVEKVPGEIELGREEITIKTSKRDGLLTINVSSNIFTNNKADMKINEEQTKLFLGSLGSSKS